ncbi:MAG: hypothetical protein RLZZ605_509 [Bacteroidota bacterium]|jgi:23S rRNA pseudouridine955/2504/2580 synthase/23S rRNA pseudouridine1911/1915/1917 synthase
MKGLEICYEDSELIIVNKPSGLLVIPDRFDEHAPTLKKQIEAYLGTKVFTVHRIDKDTSGVICFAKDEATHKYLSKLFEEHNIGKWYLGLVHGKLTPNKGSIENNLAEHPAKNGKMIIAHKGKFSHTDYEVVEEFKNHSLVSFQIHTGRTHQIRVHVQSLGHSLVGDPLYGDGGSLYVSQLKKKFNLAKLEEEEKPILNRLALHAHKLSFDKADGQTISVEAPLPKDMRASLQQLSKWSK